MIRFGVSLFVCFIWACKSPQEGLFEPCEGAAFSTNESEVGAALIPRLEGIENLLMISMDTLRVDRLGRYGCENFSPFIDSMLDAGVVLDNHHSCSSWTLPSATCVMTGQDPIALGAFPRILTGEKTPKIPDHAVTLASTLGAAGFQTLLVSANPYISEKSNLDRGFDRAILKPKSAQILLNSFLEEIDLLLENPTAPWFAHAHLIDPHTPYSPPGDYLAGLDALPPIEWDLDEIGAARTLAANWPDLSRQDQKDIGLHLSFRYGAEIRYLNDALEAFFAKLETRGVLEKTLVVLWSDHGEQFWEHGLWGHGLSLHAGENRATAAFIGPGVPHHAWKGATSHTDIAPTILTALGVAIPPEYSGGVVGTQSQNRPLFAATGPKYYPVSQSVSQNNQVLIYSWGGKKRLYDWSTDPFEQNNLYDSNSVIAQDLWAHLLPEIEALQELLPERDPPLELGP
jgi:arylsulfatase A-like enzyme